MKITEETKIKDLIPEGWKLDPLWESSYGCTATADLGTVSFFIKRNKSKTLKDYEEELNKSSDRIISKAFFSILKEDYPKQYYSIILQVIADDICDERKKREIWIDNPVKTKDIISWNMCPIGVVYFDTHEHAKQAIKIMGDKLKYLL